MPKSLPSKASVASTSRPRSSRISATSGSCSPMTATAPALMMPLFSVAISSTELPRNRSWSIAIGVTTATWPSATFVASQEPPIPTSTTATSTGASANAA